MKSALANATVLFAASLVVLMAAAPAQAETKMRVSIPFAFLAGENVQPAGDYMVLVNQDMRYMELRPLNSARAERLALTGGFVHRAFSNKSNGFLRFDRYGDAYALSGAGVAGAGEGLLVRQSKAVKVLAREHGAGTEVEIGLTQ